MTRPELALVRGGHDPAKAGTHSLRVNAADPPSPETEAGRALTMLAAASSRRLDHRELEAVRMALVENVLITGREACSVLQAWLAQCLSEYRGSRTTWDLLDTTAHLRVALARFQATALDSANLLRSILPGLGDDGLGERPQRPAGEVNRTRGVGE